MRSPSLLAHCLPALVPHDKASLKADVSLVSERDLRLPSPAIEILPSKNAHPYKYAGENFDLQGLKIFKLGCGYGIAGTFACLKGASTVHFHDLNAETIRCTTIPNVLANIEQAKDKQGRQSESPLTPSRQHLTSDVHFYAGDWEELPSVLSVVRVDGFELASGASLSLSEDDYIDACSSQEGSVIAQETSSRRSRKLSGSRAWERASKTDPGDGGYDIILISEIPHSVTSLRKLYALMTKCLRPPYGVSYLAVKKKFVGPNGVARQLKAMVHEDNIFSVHMVSRTSDREIWKFFFN